MAHLKDMAQFGLLPARGIDRSIAYPAGLDYRLMRLLNSLRHYVVKVRITFAADDYRLPVEGDVVEGHLRRNAAGDLTEGCTPSDKLALHRKPLDSVPTRTIEDDEEYERILRIECIDPLLLGDGDPVIFWEASQTQQSAWAAKRRQSLARERCKAAFFLVHVAIVFAVIAATFLPVVRAWSSGERWKVIGWCVGAFVIDMLIMGTLIVWDVVLGDAPAVSVLWRNDPSDDLEQQSASHPPTH